jgi:hypothetical protein
MLHGYQEGEMTITKLLTKILLVIAFAWSGGNFVSLGGFSPIYLLFFAYFAISFLTIGIPEFFRNCLKSSRLIDLVPVLMLLVYVYGFVVGIIAGNQWEYVIRNFAGMTLYFVYYCFVASDISVLSLNNTLFRSAVLVFFATAVISMAANLIGLSRLPAWFNVIFGNTEGLASTGQSRVIFISQINQFILFVHGLIFLINRKQYAQPIAMDSKSNVKIGPVKSTPAALLAITSAIFTLIFAAASKAHILAVMILTVGIVALFEHRRWLRLRITSSLLFLGLISLLAVVVITNTGYASLFFAVFDPTDSSNSIRGLQLSILLSDTTFWGRGLGAYIPEYIRAPEQPYGYELTYINLLHKFGAMALLVFWGFAYTIILIVRANQSKLLHLSLTATAIGAMGYLFYSWSNPALFSPQAILLHCSALYLLRGLSPKIRLVQRIPERQTRQYV